MFWIQSPAALEADLRWSDSLLLGYRFFPDSISVSNQGTQRSFEVLDDQQHQSIEIDQQMNEKAHDT